MTTTTATFTPTPLCQPWCFEHEVDESDDPQTPYITHWSEELDITRADGKRLGVCLVRHENYRDNGGATAVTIHGRSLDVDGISLTDARHLANAINGVVSREARGWIF